MERLTDHENEHYNQPGCNSCSDYRWRSCKESGEIDDCIQRLTWLRLLDIEDILGDDYDMGRLREAVGKQTEYEQFMEQWKQVAEIAGVVKKVGAERAAELVEADRDGRGIILPQKTNLKKGDRVWYVDKENGELESGTVFLASYKDGKLNSFSVDFDCGDFDEFSGEAFGKCFFGYKEAAEAALQGEQRRVQKAIGERAMEYINKKDTIEKIRRMPRTVNPDLVQYSLVKGVIAGMPSADVVPVVHGRWEPGDRICPVCKQDKFKDLDADIWADWTPPYCPNCGAKMDK